MYLFFHASLLFASLICSCRIKLNRTGYSKKLKFWSWTLVTQGIFVMTLLDNLSQKFAPKKHIFPSLIANHFTREFNQKYKGKIAFLVFWIFFQIFFLVNDFKVLSSICLIDTVLLIPILTYFMTFYAIWLCHKMS